MLAANDVWAGTDDGFYHWDGRQWARDASFEFPRGPFAGSSQNIVDISLPSPTEGWALSINRTDNLLHYTNGKWQVGGSLVTDAYYSMLRSISMISANDGWAVGYHFMAHYDGTRWSLVDTPVTQHTDVEDIDLISVKMISHDEGWVIGNTGPRYQQSSSITPKQGIILHYSRGTWGVVRTVPLILTDLVMVSANEGWVVGSLQGSNTNFFHYTNGEWLPVDRPEKAPKDVGGVQPVMSIVMASASEGWGISENGIYRYHNEMWSTAAIERPAIPPPTRCLPSCFLTRASFPENYSAAHNRSLPGHAQYQRSGKDCPKSHKRCQMGYLLPQGISRPFAQSPHGFATWSPLVQQDCSPLGYLWE